LLNFANWESSFPLQATAAREVIGLWGGVLEGKSIHITTGSETAQIVGSLEW
jgi:hypothetical protein